MIDIDWLLGALAGKRAQGRRRDLPCSLKDLLLYQNSGNTEGLIAELIEAG